MSDSTSKEASLQQKSSVAESAAPVSSSNVFTRPSSIPKRRQELLKWNGWGYIDSKFSVDDRNEVTFSGNRYQLSGNRLPNLIQWMERVMGISTEHRSPPTVELNVATCPVPVQNDAFLRDVRAANLDFSQDNQDRYFRAHGHTLEEVFIMRHGMFERLPDVVLWPRDHSEVVRIVTLAKAHDVVLIPFGGGTTVSGAVLCPSDEQRMIASVDTSQMNKILWVDEKNMTGRFEAGIIGQVRRVCYFQISSQL